MPLTRAGEASHAAASHLERRLIVRGALAGTIAGVLAFVFARVYAEPEIQAAIDYEGGRGAAQEALDQAAGLAVPHAGHELFGRTIQGNVGIGVGIILFGAALGALFAVAYTICLGRTGGLRPRSLSMLVAGAGFLGFYLVPFIKYPGNPPAIGHDETIQERSGLYLLMVFCSLMFLFGAVWLGKQLQERLGNWNAVLVAGAVFVVGIGIVMLILPSFGELEVNQETYGDFPTETPGPLTDPDGAIVFPGFPADTLTNFRLYSVASQAILWTALGLIFAPMAERLLMPVSSKRTQDELVAS